MSQTDLFGQAAPAGPAPYQVKPEHVTSRLEGFLTEMRAGSAWPWTPREMRRKREQLWPYLLGLLPPQDAARWRAELETEAARVDAAVEAEAA